MTNVFDSRPAPPRLRAWILRVAAAIAVSTLCAVAAPASASAASGLVAAYGFEEASGTSVVDSSGNGNTGSLRGATRVSEGKFGDALSFDGQSSRALIPDSPSLNLGNVMTLEAWVKPTEVTNAWRDVVQKGADNYYLVATSDRQSVPGGAATFDGTRGRVFAPSPLPVDSWSYLAVTYDGTTLRLYVNGDEVANAPQTGTIASSTDPLEIGGDSVYGQYFAGLIDEVRIYNDARSAAEIQADMLTPIVSSTSSDGSPPSAPGTLGATASAPTEVDLSWGAANDNVGVAAYQIERCHGSGCSDFTTLASTATASYSDTTASASTSYSYRVRAIDAAGNTGPYSNTATVTTPSGPSGLVAAFAFDDGSGKTVTDASPNGNNGTITNATWAASGMYGGALQFNGTNALVTIPDAASLHLSSGMTLEAWVNPSTIDSTWRDVIYKGDDNYYLEASSTNSSYPAAGMIAGGSYAEAFGSAGLPVNTWSYLAETYDGSTLRLYVNGTEVGSTAHTGSIATSANPLEIGGNSIYGQYFAGLIDEVRVYNTALTGAEIQTDEATPVNSSGQDTTPPSQPGTLTATAVSGSEVDLSWGASTDNVGVTGYQVERCEGAGCSNFTQVATATGTSYQDTSVSANGSYSYRVRAADAAGNVGPYSNTVTVTTSTTNLSVTPGTAVLTFTQTAHFVARGSGSGTVTWSVDGVAGGSPDLGTITADGLYTPPSSVGTHTVTATSGTPSANAVVHVTSDAGAFTYHNDNMRTGQDLSETVLTPSNVKSSTFGKLASYPLDGLTFASPTYVQNVNIPGQGFHDVVIVATEHDSVYAFDADGRSSSPLWHVNFTDPGAGVTTVPAADTGETGDIPNEIGITGTPVIDPSSATIYLIAKTKEVSGGTTSYVQRLHALDLATGAEQPGSPVVVQASVPGTGDGSSGGTLSFDPLRENQRTGGLLANGVVYFAFSSHGDVEPFHGWVLGYSASNLQRVMTYCTSPDGSSGGVWMNGDGVATDSTGSLYFISGDGTMDANTGGKDYGDAFIRLSAGGAVQDYFSPSVQSALDAQDLDLGSGGVLLLPDQSGTHPHEMVSAGKNGTIYLVDRDNMGQFNSGSDQIVQSLTNIFPNNLGIEGGNFSSPAYWNGSVYFAAVQSAVEAFKLANGLLSTGPTSQTSQTYGGRGGTMSISANGSSNGILWTLQAGGAGAPGTLHAYDATDLSKELYNSNQAGTRDTMDEWEKFTVPVVANGEVFVAGTSQLTVYGLLP